MALKKVACDLGNFGVKVYSDSKKNPLMFEARLDEYTAGQYMLGGVNLLKYNGVTYIPGQGDFDNEMIKINRSNLEECLACALAQTCNDKDEVVVGVGLPAEQYFRDRERMRERLKAMGEKITLEYGDPVKGVMEPKTIYIKDIIVLPESLSAYWAYENELQSKRTSSILMVDIGGRTTDVCDIVKGVDGIPVPQNPRTEILGTLTAYENIAQQFTMLTQDKGISTVFTAEQIEGYVEKGLELGETFEAILNEGDIVERAYKSAAKKISNFIKRCNPNYAQSLIVITGGGSLRIGKYLAEIFKDNSYLIEDIYCNAKGYYEALVEFVDEIDE